MFSSLRAAEQANGVRKTSCLAPTPPDVFSPPYEVLATVTLAHQDKSVKCGTTTAHTASICMKAPPYTPHPTRVIECNCFTLFLPNLSACVMSFQIKQLKGLFSLYFLFSRRRSNEISNCCFLWGFFSFFVVNNKLSLCSM